MKESIFLKKLKAEGRIELIEPSTEVSKAYLIKADNCLKSSKILLQNQLYENSVGEGYYCIYNSILALLFNLGIKSEVHSASIILFDRLFNIQEMSKIAFQAKEERIDKQYYVETNQTKSTKDSCDNMILNAESFLIKIRVLIKELTNDKIQATRKLFEELLK